MVGRVKGLTPVAFRGNVRYNRSPLCGRGPFRCWILSPNRIPQYFLDWFPPRRTSRKLLCKQSERRILLMIVPHGRPSICQKYSVADVGQIPEVREVGPDFCRLDVSRGEEHRQESRYEPLSIPPMRRNDIWKNEALRSRENRLAVRVDCEVKSRVCSPQAKQNLFGGERRVSNLPLLPSRTSHLQQSENWWRNLQ